MAVTVALYSPALVKAVPGIVKVTLVEAFASRRTDDRLNVAVLTPEVDKLIVSLVLPVFVTLSVYLVSTPVFAVLLKVPTPVKLTP